MEEWLDKHKITWPNGYSEQSGGAFGVEGYPTTFVVGADGKVVWNDYNEEVTLQQAIENALAAAEKK